jgi:hypothetical protein
MARLLLSHNAFLIQSSTSTAAASNAGEAVHVEQTENESFVKDVKFANDASASVDSVK